MPHQKLLVTRKGLQHLQQTRQKLLQQLAITRHQLRESYVAGEEDTTAMALSQQQQLTAELARLDSTLQRARLLEHPDSSHIELGSTVELATDGGTRRFTLVSSQEADPSVNYISPESPLGHSLLHHIAGDRVTVALPGKRLRFQILQVS